MLIIELIDCIQVGWIPLVLKSYISSTTGNVIPIQIILRKLPVVPVGIRGQFHTTCATTFPGRPATAGRAPAMDAGCGLSTRGHWDGPMICNEAGQGPAGFSSVCRATWRKVPCEHAKAPCWGHFARSDRPLLILVGSSSSSAVGAVACLVWVSKGPLRN
jgi:hypothetical protein